MNGLHLGLGTAVFGCDIQALCLTDLIHINEFGVNLTP